MRLLVLLRLPSGAWSLVSVPGAQRLEPKRPEARAVREDLAELPALARLRPAVPEAA